MDVQQNRCCFSQVIQEKNIRTVNGGFQNNFHPISQDSKESLEPVKVVESKEKAYTKTENELIITENPKNIKKSTIFGSAFMLTNLCLGTTIFTFAVRTKAFGLVWFLVACFIKKKQPVLIIDQL